MLFLTAYNYVKKKYFQDPLIVFSLMSAVRQRITRYILHNMIHFIKICTPKNILYTRHTHLHTHKTKLIIRIHFLYYILYNNNNNNDNNIILCIDLS